jgi:hypothetical protein
VQHGSAFGAAAGASARLISTGAAPTEFHQHEILAVSTPGTRPDATVGLPAQAALRAPLWSQDRVANNAAAFLQSAGTKGSHHEDTSA